VSGRSVSSLFSTESHKPRTNAGRPDAPPLQRQIHSSIDHSEQNGSGNDWTEANETRFGSTDDAAIASTGQQELRGRSHGGWWMSNQRDRSATNCSSSPAADVSVSLEKLQIQFVLRFSLVLTVGFVFLPGCDGAQSALNPAGRAASDIAILFTGMTIGATIIWMIVIGLSVYAIRSGKAHDPKMTSRLVIVGGAVVPTIVLVVLLCFGLRLMPELQTPPPDGSLVIHVQGERFWWRVRYPGVTPGDAFETANEIVLPVNEPVEFKLTTADVIHSFWIPSLGGKMDMISGRQTRLKLHPTREGTFRGACAEYCGTAHAEMNFDVRVVSRGEFNSWLERQQQPAANESGTTAQHGRTVFERRGCGACHTIRGTNLNGRVGPDLTHVGSRTSLGAGIMKNDINGFVRWIRDTHEVKPGVNMPSFEMIGADNLNAMAEFLESLQ